MTTKELFQTRQKDLADYLGAVAHDTNFQLALLAVDSAVLESATSPDFISGARFYKETLLTLADRETAPPLPSMPQLTKLIPNPKRPA
jgi:hypothetical protein